MTDTSLNSIIEFIKNAAFLILTFGYFLLDSLTNYNDVDINRLELY